MIVIARSGNNNIRDIVTVGLGERPVPHSYFSTHAKSSADIGKVCSCGKMPLRPNFSQGKLDPDELHPERDARPVPI
jgi:hypothetical protein